jgi:hypothetical protein
MEIKNGEIVVTVRAKNMPELRGKLLEILGEAEENSNGEEEFPENIKKIYPDYKRHKHSAAMLTILAEKHKGKTNAVDSWDLANEMMDRFPRLFKGKTQGKVSNGNIFSGTFLEKRGLLKIGYKKYEDSENEYRIYWV